MKSAWELALERTGGALQELSADKKDQIAEIDKIYKSKLAAAEIAYKEKMTHATTSEQLDQIKDDMITEKASLRSKMERERDKIRQG